MDWSNKISPIVKSIPPSGIRKFFDVGSDVISLGIGEPDFITPWHIRQRCIHSLEQGCTSYTSNQGLLELREAIVENTYENYGVRYNPIDEVLITVGVSEALDLAMRALINPGDEVLIPEPCYVSYSSCVTLAGGTVVPVPTTMEDGFKVSSEKLTKYLTPKTKILLIGYPNNPTGAVMSKRELMDIARFAEKHDLIVISDEIYAHLTFDTTHTCFTSLPGMKDRTILLNGLSKAYAMTGWRLGYALANPEIISAMTKIHQYTMLCAPVTAQIAGIEALKHGKAEMEQMMASYNSRRKLMVDGFKNMKLECFEPKGAFYIFPCIKRTGMSSVEFAEKLLEEEKVAVVPGTAFGECGEGYVRCSYATSVDNLKEALKRIHRFIDKITYDNYKHQAVS